MFKKRLIKLAIPTPIEEISEIADTFNGSSPAFGTFFTSFPVQIDRFFDTKPVVCQVSVPRHPYKLAKLVHHGYSLKKRWYVDYSAWHVGKDKLVRVRQFEPLNREKNLPRRIELGNELVRLVNAQLSRGMCLGKDHTKATTTQNEIRKLTVCDAVDLFIQKKKLGNSKDHYMKRYVTFKNNWILFLNACGPARLPDQEN